MRNFLLIFIVLSVLPTFSHSEEMAEENLMEVLTSVLIAINNEQEAKGKLKGILDHAEEYNNLKTLEDISSHFRIFDNNLELFIDFYGESIKTEDRKIVSFMKGHVEKMINLLDVRIQLEHQQRINIVGLLTGISDKKLSDNLTEAYNLHSKREYINYIDSLIGGELGAIDGSIEVLKGRL